MGVGRSMSSRKLVSAIVLVSGIFLANSLMCLAAEKPWWPVKVNSYYGTYDVKQKKSGKPAASLDGPKAEDWSPPEKADKPYVIGVSFPHLKDPYWLAVNYGIMSEAKRLGVGVQLVAAGGYTEVEKQVSQVENLGQQKVDGIILGSISYTALDPAVAELTKKKIPVVEVINDIQAQDIAGKALVSFFDMGKHAGEFVVSDAKTQSKKEINVVFLPGPAGSGWAPDTLDGFNEAIKQFEGKVNMLAVKWGDTGKNVQLDLIENSLKTFPTIDYLVGNAVAADAAVGPLAETGRTKSVKVVSTYIIPPLYEKIKKGTVAAAPSDLTVTQGQMAVDMMVRILNGQKAGKDFPFRAGPIIPTLTQANIDQYPYELLFGPRDFRPEFKVEPKK
ncbi:TMAO reductase system periplasmic protein TorT [Desulfomonile tiedjei]|uniref:Monosaccharide ABC transporter substrate-binding protein, CUT2 family n=1 Tax=Desulfomonile tiedjei (strain ATCC 49306 / DSM 6799 / DCB-1) TaxID=706587 RepID=I4C5I5_DESTA|nr:TMAO reductase system periplasmic protein TorT [Desulfomonile tiedjei]AFM24826.1 monosaccharide ABC transporter substrate-binding protein, CUT2 family [Desulfomonile tiedjei DSM 6799]